MGAPGGDRERPDVGLYRWILEQMVRDLPREHQEGGVVRLAGVVRKVYRDAGVTPPDWLDRIAPPVEGQG